MTEFRQGRQNLFDMLLRLDCRPNLRDLTLQLYGGVGDHVLRTDGCTKLRTFTDNEGHFWLEQNAAKASKWGKLARKGHEIAWEFTGPGGGYTGRMLIHGEIYTPSEATKKFLQKVDGNVR